MSADIGSRKGIAVIAVVALLAAGLAGGGVYAYQRTALDRAEKAAGSAREAAAVATGSAATTEASSSESTEQTAAPAASGKTEPPSSEATKPASSATEEQIAYINKMTGSASGGFQLSVDYIQMLTGKEAEAAYKADGHGELDGDFYIRNQNPQLRTFTLANGAKLVLLGLGGSDATHKTQVSASAFKTNVATEEYKHAPYTLTIEGGKIVRAEQMYLP